MKYGKGEAKQASREQVRGVWAAITTPFTQDGEVDEAGLRSNVEVVADEFGVDGVFCGGGMGEFWALTLDERRIVVETVVNAASGRCGVIAHTGHHCLREAIELTRHAEEVGADFVSAFTPYYPRSHEEGILGFFQQLAGSVDIGLWLIDTGLAGQAFSMDLTAKLVEIPNVCGLKVTRGDEHLRELRRLVGDQIVLSDPVESRWLGLIREGQQVFMSDSSPFLIQPRGTTPFIDYTRAAFRGDWEEAQSIAARMQPLREVYEAWVARSKAQGIPPTPWIKAWSAWNGLAAGPVRLPATLPADELANLERDLERVLPDAPGWSRSS